MIRRTTATLLVLTLVSTGSTFAADTDDLEALLLDFLANVDDRETHDRFWSEELVYTSSAGLRFGKDTIMVGFDEPEDSATASYSAEDVDIRVYDDMAIVAFVLIGTEANGTVTRYLNTGTFKRGIGGWKVVAWQATRAQ